LPWKMAAWGSHLDQRLLKSVANRFSSLRSLQEGGLITVSEGPALRDSLVKDGEDKTEFRRELVGKPELDAEALTRMRHLFSFPSNSIRQSSKHYLRLRAGRRTLEICNPPHVIVSAARNFAVYTEEFLVVPSRQIGIISASDDRDLLKALSLFLSSDFAFYHQFFTSTQFGVQRGRGTLSALLRMPMPLGELPRSELRKWTRLHSRLLKTTPRKSGVELENSHSLFASDDTGDDLDSLLSELNELVFDSLQFGERERALVNDLVHVRLELNDGKLGDAAVHPPSRKVINAYAKRLKKELDAYVGRVAEKKHAVDVIHDKQSGMIQIDIVAKDKANIAVSEVGADDRLAKQLSRARDTLRQEVAQWVYFNRDLRMYNGTKTYLFKPMQRFHWTESQAMIDANEIVAETIST
jgi:hypothetical protein